jgi:hypothetical protein
MTEAERARFQYLRGSQFNGETLTDAEQAELSRWIASIEDTEAAYLRPANDRLRAAAEALEERNRILGALIRRKESLVERLQ